MLKTLHPTKAKILDTALKLFSERGYLGTTTREIAKEARVAEVTLFRHFYSKEKLFEDIINTYSFLPALKELMPEIIKMPYEDAITLIAKRFLETLALRKDMIQIMHSEMRRYPEKIHQIYHSLIDEVVRTLALYFSEMQEKDILKDFDVEFGAMALLGMFFSHFNAEEFLMCKKYITTDTDKTIKEFVKIFARGTLK